MKVITFANEKGGVGKTTLAVHLAAGLAMSGKRVVLVDADAQGHATQLTGVKSAGGLYDLLVRKADWKHVLKMPSESINTHHNLFVLPSNVETSVIASVIGDMMLLDERLSELEETIDAVVIDTAPTPSLLNIAIYMATDGIIYPTQLETLSMSGLGATLKNFERMRSQRTNTLGKTIETFGIVPTMYSSNLIEHQSNHDELVQTFGEAIVWAKLGRRVAWVEASKIKKMVWNYAPNTPASNEALAFVAKGGQYV